MKPSAPRLFSSVLKREVASIASEHGIKKSRAFLVWLSRVAFDLTDEEALEATSLDGANDKGIDIFWIDQEEGKVIIAQGKYSEQCNHRPRVNTELGVLQNSLQWLSNPESLRRDGKPELANAAEEYLAAVRDGCGVELWFAYCGPKDKNVDKQITVYNQNPENLEARRACRHCDVTLLQTYHEQSTGDIKRLKEETISLSDAHFEYRAKFGEALVATVPATELVRLYESYEDRLFDRNVRLFLGAKKGSVNAVIAETLKGTDRNNFWAYNNGVTFVCSEFEREGNTVSMSNFCIVNGCQTTRSLVEQRDKITSHVNVLVRVLAVSNAIIDDVIRYNNSQNPIRAWDLASQHKTQRRLKKDFDNLEKPYIYITRRGDQPRTNVQKYKTAGRVRQLKLSEVAQYLAALVGKPVMAYKNKAFIFSTHHDDVFPHDIKAEEVLFASICSEEVRKVVSERRSEASETEERILIKGGPIFTMAVLGQVAQLRNGATYLKTLGPDQITSNAARERFTKYAKYAVEAYLSVVSDAIENSQDELATAIRQPEFYEKVRDRVKRKFNSDKLGGEEWLSKALPKLRPAS